MGKIHFYDIGDYLSREEKLDKITEFASIQAVTDAQAWQMITPDQHGDWLGQRDDGFEVFISIGDKKDKNSLVLFESYSRGAETGRDAWSYNSSRLKAIKNIEGMIDLYNQQRIGLHRNKDQISMDSTKVSWTSSLKSDLEKNIEHRFERSNIVNALYRPYSKSVMYFGGGMTHRVGKLHKIFPRVGVENLMIMIKQRWSQSGQLALITNRVADLQPDGGIQCFPLYLYEPTEQATPTDDLFSQSDSELIILENQLNELNLTPDEWLHGGAALPAYVNAARRSIQARIDEIKLTTADRPKYTRRDAITDDGLAHFADYYASQNNGEPISKEDLFYYIYGLLHSEHYRSRYADNLSKELPRIPRVKSYADFKHFSDAGRQLAHYHLNYETIEPYAVNFNTPLEPLKGEDFYVTKMKFGKGKDKTTVIYNNKITMTNIPLEAYDYVVNGKPALDWVMERQSVTPHKDSGIINDANDWAIETMNNPRYPLELFQRVITVSLATLKIVKGLPKLEIE